MTFAGFPEQALVFYEGLQTPYKDHAGAVVQPDGDSGALYVQLSADGLLVGGGYWHTATDQRSGCARRSPTT